MLGGEKFYKKALAALALAHVAGTEPAAAQMRQPAGQEQMQEEAARQRSFIFSRALGKIQRCFPEGVTVISSAGINAVPHIKDFVYDRNTADVIAFWKEKPVQLVATYKHDGNKKIIFNFEYPTSGLELRVAAQFDGTTYELSRNLDSLGTHPGPDAIGFVRELQRAKLLPDVR